MSSAIRTGLCAGSTSPQLSEFDLLRLHPEIEIEHDGVGRDLLTFDVEVVLGEPDAIVTMGVHVADLFRQLTEHLLIEIGAASCHTFFNVREAADRRQIERTYFHVCSPLGGDEWAPFPGSDCRRLPWMRGDAMKGLRWIA